MTAMVVAQLFIAAVMMASLAYRPLLLSLHKTLGIVILLFVVTRIGNRLLRRPPPFISTMSRVERMVAKGPEYLLYGLLLAQPLVGWRRFPRRASRSPSSRTYGCPRSHHTTACLRYSGKVTRSWDTCFLRPSLRTCVQS